MKDKAFLWFSSNFFHQSTASNSANGAGVPALSQPSASAKADETLGGDDGEWGFHS